MNRSIPSNPLKHNLVRNGPECRKIVSAKLYEGVRGNRQIKNPKEGSIVEHMVYTTALEYPLTLGTRLVAEECGDFLFVHLFLRKRYAD